jgi:predicted O-linked N-acetylglucosamine transferase (SPINDLY family)
VTASASADWLARGRNHRTQGRPVDALLCFRRAVREHAQGYDARFALAEVLWKLGRLPDAVANWRECVRIAPGHAAAHRALAEALLGLGDGAGAGACAARLLQLDPNDARARAIGAVASFASAPEASGPAVVEALGRDPAIATAAAIAGSLALALDARPSPQAAAVVDALAALDPGAERVAKMPALLLALVGERLAACSPGRAEALRAWIAAALARPWAAGDHDALRRIARVAASHVPELAAELSSHHAQLCLLAAAGAPALAWPRRTRGERLRVVALTVAGADGGADLAGALSALPNACFDVRTAELGGGGDGVREPRRIADMDADVLVDLAGLRAPAGVLLAQRPARAQITVETLGACNAAPLVDAVAPDAAALTAMLHAMHAALPAADAGMPEASGLEALWSAALDRHRQDDRAGARADYAKVLALQPEFAPAQLFLAAALREDGDIAAARAHLAAALAVAPDYVDARVAAIRAAIDAGAVADAEALATEGAARSTAPAPALLRAWGSARLAARDGAGAALRFEAALAREPQDGETHYNHGVALQMQRRNADAARAYQRALVFRPDLIAADFNLGIVFQAEGNRDAAIAAFRQVIEHDPRHAAAYKNLGEVLLAAGRFDEWRANFERFEAACPDALQVAVYALEVCQSFGEFGRLERYLEGLRQERFKAADEADLADALEQLLYLLLFFDVEPELLHRVAKTYDSTARRVYGEPMPRPAARRSGKLRVGYLSGDLRNHVMGKMIWQAVEHHDRERFELSFFSLSGERDDWTERFASIADRFESVTNLSEREAAERIAAADLDLLVDLATHTRGSRPGILARKPARVQLTHVASAGSVGLAAVDFKLTDRYADLAENQAWQLETLLPMDGCVYPYRHIEPSSGDGYRRERLGIGPDAVVIGAFVSPLKLSRRCLALWREALERIPRARLAFSPLHPKQSEMYLRLAAAGGIAHDRLVFVPQAGTDADNQARYRLVNFVLDPLPYGGANGTLEALDMGVPVVTLLGRRHAERTSYSMLENLGVADTVAASGREYVELAVRLATDHAFADAVRAKIRAGLAASPLTDMRSHARNLEAAYVEALRRTVPKVLDEAAAA